MKKKRILIYGLLAVFLGTFILSVYMVRSNLAQAQKESQAFEALVQQVKPARSSAPQVEENPGLEPLEVEVDETAALLAVYAELKVRNPDFFGWLTIEETKLDYPVMFTPTDPERYLRRGFDGAYAVSGVPFLDGGWFEGCNHYLIYGHNMKNGTMFRTILSYAERSFWEEHPIIRFDTPEECEEYEVIAAFYSKIYNQEEKNVFRYYQYIDLSDQAVFEDYVRQAKAASAYDTGIGAEYGDRLLTLSTCNYHTENGRFVVVARKID